MNAYIYMEAKIINKKSFSLDSHYGFLCLIQKNESTHVTTQWNSTSEYENLKSYKTVRYEGLQAEI